jgi:hypothetical protein
MNASVKDKIRTFDKSKVIFTNHAKVQILQRNLTEDFVLEKLFQLDKLLAEKYHEEKKTYKLVYDHSNEYKIVIAIAFENSILKIVSAYKTSKKLDKLIEKGGFIHIYKRF